MRECVWNNGLLTFGMLEVKVLLKCIIAMSSLGLLFLVGGLESSLYNRRTEH